MRLAMFCARHAPRLGGVRDDLIIDLNLAFKAYCRAIGDDCESPSLLDALVPPDSIALLRGGHRCRAAAQSALDWAVSEVHRGRQPLGPWDEQVVHKPDEVAWRAPVLHPRKIVGVGLNYRDHAEEQGAKIPKNPILFAKYDRALVGHGASIQYPAATEQLDYEAELAVVIGRTGRNITTGDAPRYIAGYTAFNDVTVRDVQFADRQWLRGKTGDTHAPMGPSLVTADEIPEPEALGISLSVNGETLQRSRTDQLIFDIPTLVSFISQTTTLEPGDVIATGTPGGVGFARTPPRFLRPGDTVRVEIEDVGTLENPVVAAAP